METKKERGWEGEGGMREEREIEVRLKQGRRGEVCGGVFFCRGSTWVGAVACLPAVNP